MGFLINLKVVKIKKVIINNKIKCTKYIWKENLTKGMWWWKKSLGGNFIEAGWDGDYIIPENFFEKYDKYTSIDKVMYYKPSIIIEFDEIDDYIKYFDTYEEVKEFYKLKLDHILDETLKLDWK